MDQTSAPAFNRMMISSAVGLRSLGVVHYQLVTGKRRENVVALDAEARDLRRVVHVKVGLPVGFSALTKVFAKSEPSNSWDNPQRSHGCPCKVAVIL